VAISPDDILIEIFYGSPAINWFSEAPPASSDISNFGVVGLRFEFITPKISSLSRIVILGLGSKHPILVDKQQKKLEIFCM